jgi:hypothetical protein
MIRPSHRLLLFLLIVVASARPAVAEPPDATNAPVASSTDYEVIELVLLDLIDYKEFRPESDLDGKKTKIVLSDLTRGGPAGLLAQEASKPEWNISEEALVDLLHRNPKRPVSLAEFVPTNERILVKNLNNINLRHDFRKTYPDARGYVKTWLPGYSKDGLEAAVVVSFGPRAHAATAVYWLVRDDGQWKVKRRKTKYYV